MTAPLRLLCLGDSYTIGEAVPESECWPNLLAGRLRAAGYAVAAPEIVARTGWTSDELASALATTPPQGPFALVTLLVGVNDQYRGRPLTEYRRQMRGLLETALRLAGGDPRRVLVVSIPDWGVTPFAEGRDRAAIATAIDAHNAQAARLAARRRVRVVDVTGISRALGASPAALAADGLHPSGDQYARWAAALDPVVREALGAG